MNDWLLIRLLMLAILVGGGVLFALAATAVERWRERRRARSDHPAGEAAVAKYCGNLTDLDRLPERRPPAGGGRGNSAAKYRSELTRITALRTSAQ